MGHQPRMLNQTLYPAQTLGKRKQLTTLQHPPGISEVTAHHRRNDASIPTLHLPLGQRVLGMAGQSGVVHLLDPRMTCEKLGDRLSAGAMPLHPQRKSFYPSQGEERVE